MPMGRRLLAAVTLALAAGAPATAHAAPTVGVQTSRVLAGASQGYYEAEFAILQQAGARFARVELQWAELEPRADDAFDEAVLAAGDRVMAAARAKGIKVLLLLQGTPCWLSTYAAKRCAGSKRDLETAGTYPPSDPAQYARAAELVAGRWAKDLEGFEVWNEPDHSNEAYWAGPDKPQRYAALLKAAYPAIKRAAPDVPVLGGAIVGANGAFLEALYREGIKGSYDVLSVHFYDLALASLRNIRAVQTRNGDDRPLFLAETGFSSCRPARRQEGQPCFTRGAQAQYTVDLLRATRKTDWIAGIGIFGLRDTRQYAFGLVDLRGRPKPVLSALRAQLRSGASAPRKASLRLLRVRGGRTRVLFTGPGVDVYGMDVYVNGQKRYTAEVRLNSAGRLVLTLPRALGQRNVHVALRHYWTGASAKGSLR